MRTTLNIRQWAARCIFASFPLGQRADTAKAADAYLDWLDTLPVLKGAA